MMWLAHLSDESPESHRLAFRWHIAHAVVYGALILLYAGAAWWHLSAAHRHGLDAD